MEGQNTVVVEEEGISITEILGIIRKRLAIIAIIVAVAFGGSIIYNFLIEKPTYESKGTMIVAYEGASNEASSTQYNFAKLVSDTYVAFINQIVVDEVAKEADSLSKGYISSHLSVSNNSLLLDVKFSAENPDCSKDVVNKIMLKAIEISDTVNDEGNPEYKLLYDNLKIVSAASEGKKVSHTSRNFMIGIAAGLVVAAAVVFLLEMFDRTFRTHEEIERVLNIPVLATIPFYEYKDEADEEVKKNG